MKTVILLICVCVSAAFGQAKMSREDYRYSVFIPEDRWREIDGKTNYAKGEGWMQFKGKVISVAKDGVLLNGWYFKPGSLTYDDYEKSVFFVKDFPYRVADDENVGGSHDFTAKYAGTYEYVSALGAKKTVRKLDYGTICEAPKVPDPTPELLRARHLAEVERQAKVRAAELKHHQELAAKDDAYGLLRMGERYLKGDGVEYDAVKGKQYLTKAADKGNDAAKRLLEKLSTISTNQPPIITIKKP
jgi:hypothetical protein